MHPEIASVPRRVNSLSPPPPPPCLIKRRARVVASDTSQGGALAERERALNITGRPWAPVKKAKPPPRKYSRVSHDVVAAPSLLDGYIFPFVWHYSRLAVPETREAITPDDGKYVYARYY